MYYIEFKLNKILCHEQNMLCFVCEKLCKFAENLNWHETHMVSSDLDMTAKNK